jgi:RHS repeat-associated protein
VYDGLNRRLQTTQQTVTNGTLVGTAMTLKSSYDPEVEFLELAVTSPTARYWKVHGPDLNGRYGGLQGTGGLEAVYNAASGVTTSILNDTYGTAQASLTQSGSNWTGSFNAVTGSGYGTAPGGLAAVPMDGGRDLASVIAWRGHYVDGTGYYYMGMRYYAPESGTFLSADPLGHAACMDLYSYCNGDPVNNLDPDGRIATGFGGGAIKGDYYKPQNTSQAIGQFLGQVGVGFTPAGILGDIRDVTAAYGDIQNDGWSWGSGTNLVLGAVGVIPGIGDIFKGAGKATLRTVTEGSQEVRTIDRAAVFSDAPPVNLSEFGNAAENALATGKNQAVFWSGVGKPGVPGYDVAMQWAAKNGGATLESTMAARGVKLPVWDSKNPAVVAAWEKAAADFASGASGHVRVLQADTVGVKSIWGRIEYKALQSNPNVQSIRSVHPETGAEFLLWLR